VLVNYRVYHEGRMSDEMFASQQVYVAASLCKMFLNNGHTLHIDEMTLLNLKKIDMISS